MSALAALSVALGRTGGYCRTCGMERQRRTRVSGYHEASGRQQTETRWACPRQNTMYVFGVFGQPDCVGLPPWSCPHEDEAYAAGRPYYGACPFRVCPDRPDMDE